jgi:hypothetical protein
VCTVLLRLNPDSPSPLLLAAVRDEFTDRAWDAPAAHWVASAPAIVGGRDRTAGGTWLAVRPDPPGIAAILNGVRLGPPEYGARPSRGGLPLAALTSASPLEADDLAGYDGFHLVLGTAARVDVWSWDGQRLGHQRLAPGDHIIVNAGVDTVDDPLLPHFAPLLAATPSPDPRPGLSTAAAWNGWVDLLAGDGLAPDDPRALIVRRVLRELSPELDEPRVYGSTSASLVSLGRSGIRYDFTGTPQRPDWREIPLAAGQVPRDLG